MPTAASSTLTIPERADIALRRLGPGVAFAIALALAAYALEPLTGTLIQAAFGPGYKLPAIVIALVLGISMNAAGTHPKIRPGLDWCVKKLLRVAIALLGIRIALVDIVGLGLSTALLVVAGMALTLAAGIALARLLKVSEGYGALAGAATAVCGASATLATATVVPHYPQKGADVAFTVVAANAVSTVVMLAYPPLCAFLGLDATATGVMLGATIHDMAQVVGAAYAVSEPVGNTAVVVKLFRVLLLLPAVLCVGWWFLRHEGRAGQARVPVPLFALGFIALCLVNSTAPLVPALATTYAPLKSVLVQASTWGLLVAIAALGLGTSIRSLLAIGWRHVALFTGTTVTILAVVLAGLLVM